jgi:hypothetical protein
MDEVERAVLILQKLLKMGMYEAMLNRISSLEVLLSSDVRLLRLHGVALGMTNDHLKARISFLAAFEISDDDIDLGNALTTFFALGEIDAASEMIELAFSTLSPDAKEVIACSAIEAVRIHAVRFEDLPNCMRTYLSNIEVIRT